MALQDNLTSYWKLDGNSNDSVGTNTGTDTAITYSTTSGKINSGASFNGSTSKIGLPNGSAPTGGNARSISMWFNSSTTQQDQLFGYGVVAAQQAFVIFTNMNGQIGKLGLNCNNGDFLTTNVVFTNDSSWVHLVVTYAGGGLTNSNVLMYVNGVLEATNNPAAATANTSNSNFAIGFDSVYAASLHLTGAVDEVAVWSRAITPQEVQVLYRGGRGLQYPFGNLFTETRQMFSTNWKQG